MARTCMICAHQRRERIEREILRGQSLREISAIFRVSEDSLQRHKGHIGQAIVKAAEKREESIGDSILSRLDTLYRHAEGILSGAKESGDGRLGLAANRELRETLGAVYKLAQDAASGQGGVTMRIVDVSAPPAVCPNCGKCTIVDPTHTSADPA